MAKAAAKKEEAPADTGEEQPKKKSKLPLILGLVVVLAAGGGGAWYFLSKGKAGDAAPEAKAQAPKPPVYVPLDNFTVNLAGGETEQYVQVKATLKVLDQPAGDAVKLYMPQIRHEILLVLTKKRAAEIAPSEGRERLSEEIRQVINNILFSAAGKEPRPLVVTPTAAPAEAQPKPAEAEGAADKPQEEGAKPEGEAPKPAPAKPAAGIAKAAPDDPVQGVYFSDFIIQ